LHPEASTESALRAAQLSGVSCTRLPEILDPDKPERTNQAPAEAKDLAFLQRKANLVGRMALDDIPDLVEKLAAALLLLGAHHHSLRVGAAHGAQTSTAVEPFSLAIDKTGVNLPSACLLLGFWVLALLLAFMAIAIP
jgi:hypothetical protein